MRAKKHQIIECVMMNIVLWPKKVGPDKVTLSALKGPEDARFAFMQTNDTGIVGRRTRCAGEKNEIRHVDILAQPISAHIDQAAGIRESSYLLCLNAIDWSDPTQLKRHELTRTSEHDTTYVRAIY